MEALFQEISTWALAMPSYASSLCGIASTVLTLLHDRCDTLFLTLLQQQPHLLMLLDKSSVVDALEAEPGLRFVEDEEIFEDPFRSVSPASSDAVLRAVMASPAPPPDSSSQVSQTVSSLFGGHAH
jgi:hypothetical protein